MMELRALHAVNQRTTKARTFFLKYQKVCVNLSQRRLILLIEPRLDVIEHNAVSMRLI